MAISRLCSIEGCGKPSRVKGWCRAHYMRVVRYGVPLGKPNLISRKVPVKCSIDGCDKPATARGWCDAHWARWKRNGHPLGGGTAYGMPERFLREVVIPFTGTECLTWPYSRTSAGYGEIVQDGQVRYVHRLACEAVHGPPPTPHHTAAHGCGKGHEGCVSPHHLRWATQADNLADMALHGTQPRGERGNAKLSSSDVLEIRRLKGAMPQTRIAARFGINPSTVSDIYRGKLWGWLT